MYQIKTWRKEKKLFIGYGKQYRLCTWPPDDLNGTLRQIRELEEYIKKLDKKDLEELKI